MPGLEYRAYVVNWRSAGHDRTSMDAPWVGRLVRECIAGKRPEFLITSLWKAHVFGALLRMLGCRWVAYFHSARFAHGLDRAVAKWAARRADIVLADSRETAAFLAGVCGVQARVVPLVFGRRRAIARAAATSPTFVYVGRFVHVKRIDLLAELVERLAESVDGAKFLFAGPTGPSTPIVEDLCRRLGSRAALVGPLSNEGVIELLGRSHFSMLMSDVEGLSMATVEALQCGCVPIVRPVGEIARYCNDNNAVLVRDTSPAALQDVARNVQALCADPATFARMSDTAIRTFEQWRTFPEALRDSLAGVAPGQS
jgi:glycosyltransferase involved in cell wall biosynthesis